MRQEKKLPRREREKLRQRQEMLAAALELFSEKGYHNVSMQEIAEKAEFAIGTFYKFFSSKEDLYQSLLLQQADRFQQALKQALEEGDDEVDKLRKYVLSKGLIFMNNVSVIRLYLAVNRGTSFEVGTGFHAEIRKRINQDRQTLAALFAQGIQRKRLKKIAEPFHLAIALESLCHAFLSLWLEAPERHPYPEDPDTILNILFKGLVYS